MSDLQLMRFETAAIQRVLHDEPDFSEFFISYLLARNARVEANLVDQLFNSSEKRLARLLLLMANFGKEGKPEPVIAKLSQETLAEMIGTTRSRVSAFMNKFRKLGFIEYNVCSRLEGRRRLCPVTPENVVSKRRNACTLLSKQLLTQREKITRRSPTHGLSSRTCSRAILPCLKA
jgi:DNA-binding MarR family transcriptional regulator